MILGVSCSWEPILESDNKYYDILTNSGSISKTSKCETRLEDKKSEQAVSMMVATTHWTIYLQVIF